MDERETTYNQCQLDPCPATCEHKGLLKIRVENEFDEIGICNYLGDCSYKSEPLVIEP